MSSPLLKEVLAELRKPSVELFGLYDIPGHHSQLTIMQDCNEVLASFPKNYLVELGAEPKTIKEKLDRFISDGLLHSSLFHDLLFVRVHNVLGNGKCCGYGSPCKLNSLL